MSDTMITAGTELPTIEQTSSLSTSVAYAGASGDHNPLHFDQEFAGQVSPTGGIIALAAVLVATLLGAILGGRLGTRYHRKVDRAGFDV